MENIKTKLLKPFNRASSYSEVADSIADGLEVIIVAENQLEDGFQWTDPIALISVEPKIREIIADASVFWAEFRQLTPDTAKLALLEAGDRIISSGKQFGTLSRFIANYLWGTASGYEAAITVLNVGQAQVLEKKALFEGQDIFPPLLGAAA